MNGISWEHFNRELRGFIRKEVPTPEDADDVLQDVFLRIHTGLGSLQDRTRLHSWIHTLARRAVADFYRERYRSRTTAIADIDTAVDAGSNPWIEEEPVAGRGHDLHEEVLSWLIPMMETLPEKYREPLRMAEVEGMTGRQIADRLGLSLSGTKSRVQRARRLLGETLAACCRVELNSDGRAVEVERVGKCTIECNSGN